MNILIIKNPIHSQPHGGGERHTMQVANHWRQAGHKIYFATTCPYLGDWARRDGFEVEDISWAGQEAVTEKALAKFTVTWPLLRRRWKTYLKQKKKGWGIDCLYIYSWNEKFLLGQIARSLGLKMIFVEHRLLEKFIKLNPFRTWYVRNSRQATVVAVSEAVKRGALEVGVPAANIKVIYNGIDLEEFHGFCPVAHKNLRLGTISRLSSDKGLESLIAASAPIAKTHENLEVDIVGAGPDEKPLRQKVIESGLKGTVKFIGSLPREEVVKFLGTLDIFTLTPTHGESFGLVLAEAGAAGLPCVVTDVGGVAEVVKNGETGIVVPPGNLAALTVALKKLLDNPAWRDRLGQAARRRVEKMFTLERMLSDFDKILTP